MSTGIRVGVASFLMAGVYTLVCLAAINEFAVPWWQSALTGALQTVVFLVLIAGRD